MVDSLRITAPREMVKTTIMGGHTCGRTWLRRILQVGQPTARAASTYGFSLVLNTTPRTVRMLPMPVNAPRTTIMGTMPCPRSDITVSTMNSHGKASHASTNRCTIRSNVPPQ